MKKGLLSSLLATVVSVFLTISFLITVAEGFPKRRDKWVDKITSDLDKEAYRTNERAHELSIKAREARERQLKEEFGTRRWEEARNKRITAEKEAKEAQENAKTAREKARRSRSSRKKTRDRESDNRKNDGVNNKLNEAQGNVDDAKDRADTAIENYETEMRRNAREWEEYEEALQEAINAQEAVRTAQENVPKAEKNAEKAEQTAKVARDNADKANRDASNARRRAKANRENKNAQEQLDKAERKARLADDKAFREEDKARVARMDADEAKNELDGAIREAKDAKRNFEEVKKEFKGRKIDIGKGVKKNYIDYINNALDRAREAVKDTQRKIRLSERDRYNAFRKYWRALRRSMDRKAREKLKQELKQNKKWFWDRVQVSYDNTKWCKHGQETESIAMSLIASLPQEPSDVSVYAGLSDPNSFASDQAMTDWGIFETQEEAEGQKPKYTVHFKVTQTVLNKEGEYQTEPVSEVILRIDVSVEPELPHSGNERKDTGFGGDPNQALTDNNGTCNVELSTFSAQELVDELFAGQESKLAALPDVSVPQEIEIDMTPQEWKICHVSTAPGATLASILSPELKPYVKHHFSVKETMLIAITYAQYLAEYMNDLIAGIPGVTLVEPNNCEAKKEGPNDLYFKSKSSWGQPYDDQWAIKRIGFTADETSAWNLIGERAEPVVVAVIDSGLDWNHLDFSWDNIWKNEDEIPDNEIDDDNNGYVDDIIGWDFLRSTNIPWDRDGHGTFISGLIAASRGNGVGIAGINPSAKIMVLKALNDFGHTRASYVAEAIVYAADNGARVINLSVGGENITKAEQIAIEYAHSQGVVIVVAAGNEGADVSGFGPACVEQVITVASSDVDDKRAVFSNWGQGIDITAPGIDVLSLRARYTDLMLDIPGVKYEPRQAYVGEDTRYYRASGTSFSSPLVAGVASLILSVQPELSNQQVERMILHSARDIEVPGVDQYTGYGLLDARAAFLADPQFFVEARIDKIEVVTKKGKPVVRVWGLVNADKFARAWMEVGRGENPIEWRKVSRTLTAPVKDGVLDDLEAKNFAGSQQWTLRLIVEHENGKRRVFWYRIELE